MNVQQLMDGISDSLGIDRFQVGVGGTIPVPFMAATVAALGVDPATCSNNYRRIEAALGAVGLSYSPALDSSEAAGAGGNNITTVGLERLLDGIRRRTVPEPRHSTERSRAVEGSVLMTDGANTSNVVADDEALDAGEADRVSLEAAIAKGLAELSSAEPTPDGEVEVGSPFEEDEVVFTDSSWVEYLRRVQDWLRFPAPLDDSGSLSRLAEDLFTFLGFDDLSAACIVEDGRLAVTTAGLDRLVDRVDRAVALKDDFKAEVEAAGIAAATAQWIAAWEEPEPDLASGPVIANAKVWAIGDFIPKATKGQLNLSPSYQRADVWPTKDAELLIESILRGIPLPSVILLKRQDEADGANASRYEVVDGKQRLTSILRFVGQHPLAIERVKAVDEGKPELGLMKLFRDDYPKFRVAWKNATGETLTATLERDYYFPFRLSKDSPALSGELEPLRGHYYCAIRERQVTAGGEKVTVEELFEKTVDYKIPLIEYSEATPRQIHDVFNLYNRQGKHLNAEEIRNALFHEVDLMRALSVAAGDNRDLIDAAPFLAPIEDNVASIAKLLDDYRFGDARYRRTKVLSWLFSMLFVEHPVKDGVVRKLSTANQIDYLLTFVDDPTNGHPLREPSGIVQAMLLVEQGLETHQSLGDGWVPEFRNAKGTRWQELQLVASVLGVALCAVVLGEETADRLFDHEDAIHAKSSLDWKRPAKTQTAIQWEYIARVALGIVDELGISRDDVDRALKRDYRYSCISGLEASLAEKP